MGGMTARELIPTGPWTVERGLVIGDRSLAVTGPSPLALRSTDVRRA